MPDLPSGAVTVLFPNIDVRIYLAAAALAQGRKERAGRLMEAAAQREAVGRPASLWWRRPRERIGDAVRAAFTEAELAAARAGGPPMGLEPAIAFALQEIGE